MGNGIFSLFFNLTVSSSSVTLNDKMSYPVFLMKMFAVPEVRNLFNREVADSRTLGIFIRDTLCFHCYSMNCDSKFSEFRMKMSAVRESPTSLLSSPVVETFSHRTWHISL